MKFHCRLILILIALATGLQACNPGNVIDLTGPDVTLLDDSGNEIVERTSTSYALAGAAKVGFDGTTFETPSTVRAKLEVLLKPVMKSEVLELPTKEGKQLVGNWTGIRLADGSVLVYGRRRQVETPYFGLWSFDPKLQKAFSGPKVSPISSPELTLLIDGRVLLTGGLDESKQPSARSLIYDPSKSTLQPCGKLICARVSHSAMQLTNGDVAIVGGENVDFASDPKNVLDSVEVLDLRSANYVMAPNLAIERRGPILIPFENSKVVVVGGWHIRHNLWGDHRWVRVAETIDCAQRSK